MLRTPVGRKKVKLAIGDDTMEELYYIQDTRNYVGNSVLWWRPNGTGYTTNLVEAWRVPATWKGRDTDKLWLCVEIDRRATWQFDMQKFQEIK